MDLFLIALRKEVRELHSNNIRLRIIGDRTVFGEVLVNAINDAENLTAGNDGLNLTIAANYGGRWDLVRAVNLMSSDIEYQGKNFFSELTMTHNLTSTTAWVGTETSDIESSKLTFFASSKIESATFFSNPE